MPVEQELRAYILKHKQEAIERRTKWECCGLLKSQTHPPPTKPHLLTLSKQNCQLETRFKYMTMRATLIQTTTEGQAGRHSWPLGKQKDSSLGLQLRLLGVYPLGTDGSDMLD